MNPNETSENNNDSQMLQGDPASSFIEEVRQANEKAAKATGQAPTQEQAPTQQKAQDAKIYLGDKVFSSQDELRSYVRELEATRNQYESVRNQFVPQQQAQQTQDDEIETVWYTDPKRALQIAQERAANAAEQRIRAAQEADRIRNTFYSKYPDLRGQEDLVQMYTGRLEKEVASLPEDEQLSKLANAVRSRLASIKGANVATEELSNRRATVAGENGGAPMTGGAAAKAPMTMVDQMKSMRPKKGA